MKSGFKVTILSLLLANTANAADIDYSGLEKVFGEPVTTSATGKPQRASESPVSMEIVTADQIRQSGALDIPEILRNYAGIDVSRNFKSQADMNIRGYNQPLSNRLLVLINNRQVYQDIYGNVMWNGLPIQLAEIKQIEVIRGPNTSLFGFNAASGVINIVTYNPLYDSETFAQGRVGTDRQGDAGTAVTLKAADNIAIRVSGGHRTTDDYSRKKMSKPVSSKNALISDSFNADSIYKINDKATLKLEFGFNDNKTDSALPFYYAFKYITTVRSYKAEFTYDAEQLGLWTAQAYRNESSMILDALLPPSDGITYNGDPVRNPLDVFQLSGLFSPHPDHTLRLGGEYRNNPLQGDDVGINGKKQFTMNIASVSAMWDWKILDNLSFTNSVRFDNWRTKRDGDVASYMTNSYLKLTAKDYKRNENEYSFNSALLYKVTPETSLRLSAARGLHIPSLTELSWANLIVDPIDGNSVPNYGNPHLKTEINTTIEAGFEQKFLEYNTTLGVNVFHEHLQNVIGFTFFDGTQWNGTGIDTTSPVYQEIYTNLYDDYLTPCSGDGACATVYADGAIADAYYNAVVTGNPQAGLTPGTITNYPEEATFTNTGKSSTWGTEVTLRGKFYDNKFNWMANYTLTMPKDTPNGQINRRVDFKTTQPRHKVNLLLGFTDDPYEINISMNYVGKADYNVRIGNLQKPNQHVPVKPYYILNAHLGYKFMENTRIMFDGLNLTGHHHERPDFASFIRNPVLGANSIGTTYIATLKQNF
ncbi:MAG: TonB-dependent receptor plug domain-containing protein [Rickettsiales bacterium]